MYYFAFDPIFQLLSGMENPAQSSIKINILNVWMQFGNECQHTDMQTHTRTHAYAHTHTRVNKVNEVVRQAIIFFL